MCVLLHFDMFPHANESTRKWHLSRQSGWRQQKNTPTRKANIYQITLSRMRTGTRRSRLKHSKPVTMTLSSEFGGPFFIADIVHTIYSSWICLRRFNIASKESCKKYIADIYLEHVRMEKIREKVSRWNKRKQCERNWGDRYCHVILLYSIVTIMEIGKVTDDGRYSTTIMVEVKSAHSHKRKENFYRIVSIHLARHSLQRVGRFFSRCMSPVNLCDIHIPT